MYSLKMTIQNNSVRQTVMEKKFLSLHRARNAMKNKISTTIMMEALGACPSFTLRTNLYDAILSLNFKEPEARRVFEWKITEKK